MNQRFVLTAAATSAAAIGATAAAEVVTVSFHLDVYPGESAFYISDGAGTIAQSVSYGGVTSSDSRYISSSYGYYNGSSFASGYFVNVTMDLGAGTYDVLMTDTYGDGWSDVAWGYNTDGSNAFTDQDGNESAFSSGNSATASFTVVPAPGALALLALAGVAAGGRRRK